MSPEQLLAKLKQAKNGRWLPPALIYHCLVVLIKDLIKRRKDLL